MLNLATRNMMKGRVAKRLAVSIIIFSSLITIITTAVQLYFDYRKDILQIENYFSLIKSSYVSSLANSVWLYDDARIEMQLNGLLRLRDIEYVEIRTTEDFVWSAGTRGSRYTISDQLPLIERYKDQDLEIGQLLVVASVDSVYGRLADRVLIILLTNAFKTFLVAGFILVLFQFRVTRHLMKMADYFASIDFARPNGPLVLDRSASHHQADEIDQLAAAINTTQTNLFHYVQLRDQAEKAVIESEMKYRFLVDNAQEGICVAQGAGLQFVNPKLQEILGRPMEELTANPFVDFIHPDDRSLVLNRYVQRLRGIAQPSNYEFRVVRKDGEIRWVEVKVVSIQWAGKHATLNFLDDITERKQDDEKLKASLHKNEILLKELNHRVKNNMQVIISLMNLQSNRIYDPELKAVFLESQNRIHAMSAVHETLYRSDNGSNIDLARYLSTLSEKIFQTYWTKAQNLVIHTDFQPTSIDLEKSYPVGLIFNELLTNALKYAFPEERGGEISIRGGLGESSSIELVVADNGVGLPDGFDWRNTGSLGLQIVRTLVEDQLEGAIDLESSTGAAWIITFPI